MFVGPHITERQLGWASDLTSLVTVFSLARWVRVLRERRLIRPTADQGSLQRTSTTTRRHRLNTLSKSIFKIPIYIFYKYIFFKKTIDYFCVERVDGNPDDYNIIEHFGRCNVVFVRVLRVRIFSIVSCMSPSLLGSYNCRNPQAGLEDHVFSIVSSNPLISMAIII